jgi:hypothetical protein
VWREVGPVYIHAARCEGYAPTGRLPGQLVTGPRVLLTYRADDTMNYEHNTVVTDETDLQPIIERLLSKHDVTTVHVRTLRRSASCTRSPLTDSASFERPMAGRHLKVHVCRRTSRDWAQRTHDAARTRRPAANQQRGLRLGLGRRCALWLMWVSHTTT